KDTFHTIRRPRVPPRTGKGRMPKRFYLELPGIARHLGYASVRQLLHAVRRGTLPLRLTRAQLKNTGPPNYVVLRSERGRFLKQLENMPLLLKRLDMLHNRRLNAEATAAREQPPQSL